MPEITFIGRKKYLTRFRQLLNEPPGAPYILNLRGPGGMGKTKILQQFVEICNQENIPHTGIIDFYNSELNSQVGSIELAIAKVLSDTLESGPFANYWEARQKAEEARRNRDERYGVLRERSKNQFIANLSEWANKIATTGKKGILLFDTFEAVKNNQVGARLLNEWLPVLKPAIVVLSGRQATQEIEFPKDIANLVEDVPVEAFTNDEAIDYLKERAIWETIEKDNVADTLFALTERQPLRLALSADRLTRYNFVKPISPAELVEGANKADFEKKLVEDLAKDIEYPESTVLPAMAHIPRPFDAELIKFLLPENIDEPETILKNLSELSFVKEIKEGGELRYWFQDELRYLFHKYVFLADSFTWTEMRRHASEKMVAFYQAQITAADGANDIPTKERLIADRFYHEIYLDPDQKFTEAQQEFQAARDAYEIQFANMILGAVRSAVNFLNEEQKFSLKLMEARSLRDSGYLKLSERQLLNLLNEYGKDLQKAVFIYNALGGIAERLGELANALTHYQKSLELSQQLDLHNRLSLEEINIGRVHQLMGYWELARDHFKQAYELAMASGPDWDRAASSLAERGYVHGLLGQHDVGIDYCSQAIKIWEKLGLPQQAARGKVLRGVIYRFAGSHEEALKDVQEAIQTFSQSNYVVGLAEAYFQFGLIQWFQSNKMTYYDEFLLKKAQDSLETSIGMARERSLIGELTKALSEISRIYWIQGKKEKARQFNAEAYQLASNGHDAYYAVNSLLAMAEFDYDEGKYDTIQEYVDKLKHEFEDQGYKFLLFFGRMRRILGSSAFRQKNYDEATQLFSEGLYLIAQQGSKWRMNQELNQLKEHLQTLPPETALRLYNKLKQDWTEQESSSGNISKLVGWVDRQINDLTFQMLKS